LARGKSRSDTIENVINNAKQIAKNGVKEIVLTGVNIGDFGYGLFLDAEKKKRKDYNFLDLIKALDEVEGIERFRISSIEPNLLKDEIIEFVANSKKFVPHFHIPLQSGNNELLGLMKRRYQRELYAERIAKIKSLMPDCCIGVDVIVGFPGETENHFLDTYHFIQSLDISYLHVFTYSERVNTPAIELSGIVPPGERKKRNKMLRVLSAKKLRAFYESQKNKQWLVLFEQESKQEYMCGFTPNYVKVKVPYDSNLANTLQNVRLIDIDTEGSMEAMILESVIASNSTI
jgi:threonylcarbamoyladenosine tRNA methylthiotransferase MtaB